MKKIKVYDIDAYARQSDDMQMFEYRKAAIFIGKRGVVIAEYEAIHRVENLVTDSVRFGCNKVDKENPDKKVIFIIPSHEIVFTINEIIENAPCEEMEMLDFFTKHQYNVRCRSNYATLLSSLKEIGYELDEKSNA